MKTLLFGLMILSSLSSLAQVSNRDSLPLSTIINAQWPALELLLNTGVGSCRLETRGGFPLFYSERDNGFPVNASRQYYVRDAIRNGDCGDFSVDRLVANAQWSTLELLLKTGVGSCRLEVRGGFPLFYSSRDYGFPVNASRQYYVRDAIRNGDCL